MRVLLLLLALSCGALRAETWLEQPTQTPWRQALRGIPDSADADILQLEGVNTGQERLRLIIRLDDYHSPPYNDRYNGEFWIAPGAFQLQISAAELRTAKARPLKKALLNQIIVFAETGSLSLKQVRWLKPLPLPGEAIGWDLGPVGSPVLPGFQPLYPDSPALQGRPLAVRRPGPDALVQDGIDNVDSIRLPVAPGHYRVSLWLADPGEWEWLPHPLQRQVKVNGEAWLSYSLTPEDWIKNHYLSGQAAQASQNSSPVDLLMPRRSGRLTKEIDVTDSGLHISLAGSDRGARFLAAVLIEPHPSAGALENVIAEQRRQFSSRWPHEQIALPALQPGVLTPISATEEDYQPDPLAISQTAAQGGWVAFDWLYLPATDSNPPHFNVTLPPLSAANSDQSLPVELRYGHWRYGRPDIGSQRLQLNANDLEPVATEIPNAKDLPLRLHALVHIPADTPPGHYRTQLTLLDGNQIRATLVELQVLAMPLPPASAYVGVYYESGPQWQWFKETERLAEKELACDLNYLKRFSFTTMAAPWPTPEPNNSAFLKRAEQLAQAGLQPPWVAYTPIKRLLGAKGNAGMAELKPLIDALQNAKLGHAIAWSLADEPEEDDDATLQRADYFHALYPQQIRLAQLNKPGLDKWLSHFDMVMLNHGFNLTESRLALAGQNRTLWLYNLPRSRLAAGFYLWRSGAEGYLQWHARMPTADPYDPTDGREGDAQLFLPNHPGTICSSTPGLNQQFFALSEGLQDLRWLTWLDLQAATQPAATKLRQQLRAQLSPDWSQANKISDQQLNQWRTAMLRLAQSLLKEQG